MPNPVDDLKNAEGSAKALYKLSHDLSIALGADEKSATAYAHDDAKFIVKLLAVLGHFLQYLIAFITPFILFFLDALTNIRKECGDAFEAIGSAVLSEFLGTEVKVHNMKEHQTSAKNVEISKALGDALYTQLLTEFGPGQPLKPGDGERAAKIFSGYAINFAVQNALISTLVDAESLHFLGEFRELGVEVARNLGLGRLQRLALGTLLQQVIQKPYQRDLAAKYRPDRLSTVEYVHAFHRGNIDATRLHDELAQLGYREEDIPLVIQEYQDKLSIEELVRLVRHNAITQDVAIAFLVTQGVDQDTANLRWQSAQYALIDDNVKTYVDTLDTLVKNNRMDLPTWDAAMVEVPWTDDEKAWQRKALYANLQHPERMLTWTQVITAYENGIVDVTYVETWLQQKGYSDEDILNMELILAVKFDEFAAKAASKGKPAPAKKPAPPA